MTQRIEYTITFNERNWWGGHKRLVLVGTGSSKKDDELLVFLGENGFESINYGCVQRVTARVLEHDHTHE